MSKDGIINWKTFEKFLFFIGCEFKREKGDHRIYWRDGIKRPIVIPRDKELSQFIIRNNLKILEITYKQFLEIKKQL